MEVEVPLFSVQHREETVITFPELLILASAIFELGKRLKYLITEDTDCTKELLIKDDQDQRVIMRTEIGTPKYKIRSVAVTEQAQQWQQAVGFDVPQQPADVSANLQFVKKVFG